MNAFRMPSLGADMEAGTLVEWLKKPGDTVSRGDIVAVVETEKGAIDVEIFEDGVVQSLLVEPGRKVPVGTPLAMIGAEGEAPEAPPPPEPAPAAPPAPHPAAPAPVAAPVAAPVPSGRPAAAAPPSGGLRISPVASRRAAELGVALAGIKGTGPGGAIRLSDVEAAARQGAAPAPQPAAAPAQAAETPQAAMRRAIGAAMARSKREIPHYYLGNTVDVTPALDWLEARNQERGVAERLLPGVLFIKAVALAARETPEINGVWQDGVAAPSDRVHIGWAVSLRAGGLIAPAIHDADAKDLDTLMADLRDVVKRARGGGLRSSELSDPTITITNLGERGVATVYGVIYPPQLALVGIGRVVERPWVVDGSVVPRRMVDITLSGDHRASDGHRGALFLAAVERHLQEPDTL